MKTAAKAILLATSLAGVAAPVALIVDQALPGRRIESWISTQPQTGPSHCHKAARHRRDDPDYQIPPECANSMWNDIVSPPPGEAPPSPVDAPPPVDAQPPSP
jgi:hypothetical protein